MALAWKCDRCKNYFSHDAYRLEIKPVMQIQKKGSNEIEEVVDKESEDFIFADLCKECAAIFYEEL